MHEAHQLLQVTIICSAFYLGCSQTGINVPVPLAVKSPYLSVWTNGPHIDEGYTRHLNWSPAPFTLLVKINDTTYTIAPQGDKSLQTGLKVTPTQSIFNITIGPVIITYKFFTPIDTDDLKRLSLPVSYVAVSALSTDNQTHPVKIVLGWDVEWWSHSHNATIQSYYKSLGPVVDLYMENLDQVELSESKNSPLWGTFHVFTNKPGTWFAVDNFGYLRKSAPSEHRSDDTEDKNFRPSIESYPAIIITKDILAGLSPSPNVFFGMARVARPAVDTVDGPANQLWEDFFNGDEKEMIKFAFEDAEGALARCEALDAKILSDAAQEGGQSYSKVVSFSLRQAFGGIELTGTKTNPKAFLRMSVLSERRSSNCQPVDVMYANMPVHLYLNPKMLKYLLEPLLEYQESGVFEGQWALSDLGDSYPQCTGGYDRAVGVEQSANMIIMIDAYVRALNDTDFAAKHYAICKQWAEYLVSNGLYPGEARTSDILSDRTVNSTNLSLKAIIAIAAMADIAQRANNTADYSRYRSVAEDYTVQWIRLSQDPKKSHIKSSYNDDGPWVLLYNLYADFLLETNLIPNDVINQQQLWYLSTTKEYRLELKNHEKRVNVASLLFTAAASPIKLLRNLLYDRVAFDLVDEYSPNKEFNPSFRRTEFSEYFFFNSPIVGAVFAPLTTRTNIKTFSLKWDLSD